MNFFEHQAQARRQSGRLVVMFVLAVIAVLVAVNAVVAFLFTGFGNVPAHELWGTVAMTSLVVLAVVGGAVLLKLSQLRAGGGKVAESLGGTRVSEDTRDFQLRRLRNIVEEIAIASGVPVPAVYVLEREDAINAFAAGYTPSDAAIAVTRGALDRLNREELQGVIAHEYSHILNGDMRLNIRLMGWLFGILVIAIIGRRLASSARFSRNRNSGGIIIAGLAVMAVGYIGVLFGHMIKAAVSRSREYLADASAVQFTRQPTGLSGALKKIGGIPQGSLLQSADTEDVSHMLFANGLRSRTFATHPPLLKRIAALEPGFDAKAYREQRQQIASRYDGRRPDEAVAGFAAETPAAAAAPAAALETPAPAADLLAQAGRFGVDHVALAAALRAGIPDKLRDAVHAPSGALAVLLALLLDNDEPIRARQREAIVEQLGEAVARSAEAVHPQVQALPVLLRTPLASLAMPALRRLPVARLHALRDTVPALIHADGRIAMIEYLVGAMLESQLDDTVSPRRAQAHPRLTLDGLGGDAALLLTVMAGIGNAQPEQAAAAYNAGIAHVLSAPPAWREHPDWYLHLDDALQRLDRLMPERKERLLQGLVRTMQHNHRITADEYELLRAACAALHCPLPPLADTSVV